MAGLARPSGKKKSLVMEQQPSQIRDQYMMKWHRTHNFDPSPNSCGWRTKWSLIPWTIGSVPQKLVLEFTLWFGFGGGDEWWTLRDSFISTLTSNPNVSRCGGVQFGSGPPFGDVSLTRTCLPGAIAKAQYDVLSMPAKSTETTSGGAARSQGKTYNWFIQYGGGKKMYFNEPLWEPRAQVWNSGQLEFGFKPLRLRPTSRLRAASPLAVVKERFHFVILVFFCAERIDNAVF
ncbi:hypothetical protein F5141DRAFT_1061194 [Pisolithus sp. B1]|nr:hypothetical protein F5141DRAFT_1061194 [Pisolithus sp. B1]